MDKNKVKKLLEDADICFLGYERNGCRDLVQMGLEKLHEAQEELSKSDWVSVEDRLPEYCKDVLVCNKNFPNKIWVDCRDNIASPHFCLGGNFAKFPNVTHWKPIEKLEK